jgi:hypothetical protein
MQCCQPYTVKNLWGKHTATTRISLTAVSKAQEKIKDVKHGTRAQNVLRFS